MARSELNISEQVITPDQAKTWLDQNTHNRKISKKLVESLSRDMATGKWQMNGDAIRFNCDGLLIDGQHRLLAVVQSKAKIKSVVITGLPKSVQETVDMGRRRTAGDVLQLRGFTMANMLAATAVRLMDIKAGVRLYRPTTAETTEFIEARPNLAPVMAKVCSSYPVYARVLGAVYYIGHHVIRGQKDSADAFLDVMLHGESSYSGDPAHKFREKLIRVRAAKQTLPNWAMICSLLRVYDAFAAGEQLEKIYFTDEIPDVRGFNRERI